MSEDQVSQDAEISDEQVQEQSRSIDVAKERKKKQKKRKRDDVLLEDLYMNKLAEQPAKLAKTSKTNGEQSKKKAVKPLGESESDEESEAAAAAAAAESASESGSEEEESDSDKVSKPVHESMQVTEANTLVHETAQRQDRELEKAKATIFVGNLPTTVITSHTDYKKLKSLFAKYGRVKSIRFRSIAFSELLPRKVAFVQGKFHPERDTFNAYIVFADPLEARKSLELNGHYFLEKKHIRVDSVAHPAAHNNKKCVFVGSLPFDAEEELLWTHFSPAGEIESVRLIRDKKTNVGKGFAYVQYKDSSAVQNALLMHEKKMLLGEGKGARKLRVTRAQNMPSKHKADQKERDQINNPDLKPRDKAKLGRVKNLMGSQAAAKLKILQKEIALEGERAKAPDGERTRKKKKKSKKDTLRSKARAAAYRKTDSAKETGTKDD